VTRPRVEHRSAAAGGRDDWQTPEEILALVRAVAPIGLDPCTSGSNPVDAHRWLVSGGLEADWQTPSDELTYVNPPYSQLRAWLARCALQARGGGTIAALIAARTDTRAWHESIPTAQAVCLWRGRVKFRGAAHSAPFPSALVIWTRDRGALERFDARWSPRGMVIPLDLAVLRG
jgi:hypothetical protein